MDIIHKQFVLTQFQRVSDYPPRTCQPRRERGELVFVINSISE